MKKIVVATGGFDPVHSGHISYLQAARKLGDWLIVGVNSDAWLERKKGRAFMPFDERINIIRNLVGVDHAIGFDDSDDSARAAIEMVRASYPQNPIIFANGGDRTPTNIPEMSIQCPDLEFQFRVGGTDKANSSSWILEEWKSPRTPRPWGYYRVLHQDRDRVKVKELTVDPGQRLSMQRHTKRGEFWFVTQGIATVCSMSADGQITTTGKYQEHQSLWIFPHQWHQLCNDGDRPLKIIEIQYGANCKEDDIERLA
jgi:cytidyltransferase-like protein